MMPKNRLQHFVVTRCVLSVPSALGECVPVVPLLRVAVRKPKPRTTSPTFTTTSKKITTAPCFRALLFYPQAIKLDPQNTQPVINLANIYWAWKVDEANSAKYYEQAIQMPKNNGIANAYYAGALLDHGKRDQAMIEAQEALTLGYTSHPVFKALGLRNE